MWGDDCSVAGDADCRSSCDVKSVCHNAVQLRTLYTVRKADDLFSSSKTKREQSCLESERGGTAQSALRVAVKTSQRNGGCDNGRSQPASADHNCAEPYATLVVCAESTLCMYSTCALDIFPSTVSKIVEQSSTRNKKCIQCRKRAIK